MGFISDATLLELVLGAVLIFFLYYFYSVLNYSYWKKRSIAFEKPRFPFGTDKNVILFRQPVGSHYQRVYNKFKEEKVIGMFNFDEPYLLIRDSELLREIMAKDFHHFVDRGMVDPDILDPVNRHLFNMQGDSWKSMRNKLIPAFTSGKMKTMFVLMEACCNEFIKALEPIAEQNGDISIKNFLACFTTDVIASCAFGLQSNSIKHPDNEFRENGNKVISAQTLQMIKQRFCNAYPRIYKMLPVQYVTNGAEQFFLNVVGDTVSYRQKTGFVRNDFIDTLLKLKSNRNFVDERGNGTNEHQNDATGLTLEEMAAQALLFFAAGFETTSSVMSFCLYELSLNPEVQVKMRKEVDEVLQKNSGKPTYEMLKDMPYVEAVINETLRRYASLPILNRQCTEDYKIPEMNFIIPKGMKVIIPSYAIHHDPEYYPEPYRFDPERFTNEKISTKNNYTFMPFGEGPRMCIGNRFAMMQMKMCLARILQSFELSVTKGTPVPMNIDNRCLVTTPELPIVLKISKRRV